jgi:hypothetical protein
MKAFLDTLNVSSEEDEEASKSSSDATIDSQRDLIWKFRFCYSRLFFGICDLSSPICPRFSPKISEDFSKDFSVQHHC